MKRFALLLIFFSVWYTSLLNAQNCGNHVHSFDGIDDYIEYNEVDLFFSQFTLGFWFNAGLEENGNVEDRFFSFGTDRRLELGIETNGNLWLFDYNVGKKEFSVNVRDGKWHQMVFLKDGLNNKIILDNEVVAEYNNSNSWTGYGDIFRLGSWAGSTNDGGTYLGMMDDFFIYHGSIYIEDYCSGLDSLNIIPLYANNFEEIYDYNLNLPFYANQGSDSLVVGNIKSYNIDSSHVCMDFIKSCDSCTTDYLNLSTGINPENGYWLNLGINPYWQLVDGPEDGRGSYPRSSYVILANNAWDTAMVISQYISATETYQNFETYDQAYVFEQEFSVCDYTQAEIRVKALFDNFLKVELVRGEEVLHTFFDVTEASENTFNEPVIANWGGSLEEGTYALRAHLSNDGVVAMGMAMEVGIHGTSLKKINCDQQDLQAKVSGFVICEDLYQDTIYGGVANVQLELYNVNTSESRYSTSLQDGYYEFIDVPSGTYRLNVVNQESSPEEYNFTVSDENASYYFNFDVCPEEDCCIGQGALSYAASNINVYDLSFTGDELSLDLSEIYNLACDMTVSVQWGDGQVYQGNLSENVLSHRYNESGVYVIYIEYYVYSPSGESCAYANSVINVAVQVCDESSSTAEEASRSYTLYPNPTTEILNIDLTDNPNGYSMKIYDVKGALVLKETIKAGIGDKSVDISNLSNGIYQLILEDESSKLSSRFIKM